MKSRTKRLLTIIAIIFTSIVYLSHSNTPGASRLDPDVGSDGSFDAVLRVQPALAAGGDFKNTDFVAAAPYTYDHDTGGGAYDDRTVGDTNDVVEQLEGAQFACDDIITFLTAIEIDSVAVDPVQAAEFDFRFLADSTGQSGAAITDIVDVLINYGPVQAGDGPEGEDLGIQDDGGSTATLVTKTLTGPAFTAGSVLLATVQVTDLEPGEKVILRVDARLSCKPDTRPTGNLQAQLDAARVVGSGDVISTGQQTIPFLRIDDIKGAGEPWLKIRKTATTQDGNCQTDSQEELSTLAFTGPATVKFCFVARNPGTYDLYDLVLMDDNGTPADPTDDFEVLLSGLGDLDGEGDQPDLATGASATGEALVTLSTSGTVVNTATGSGNNGASGSNYTFLTMSDGATVYVIDSPSQLSWQTETTFVAFEDLKNVARSDWDYNDLVVKIDVDKGLTAGGDLAAMILHYDSMARGASLEHSFLHEIPLIGGGQAELTVNDPAGTTITNSSFAFNAIPTFTIFDSTKAALPPGTDLVNTVPGQPLTEGYTATLTLYLDEAARLDELTPVPWDPYIFVPDTNQEVHLTIPGHLDNVQMVNAQFDPTSPLLGFYLPLAHVFEAGWEWPIEAVGLWRGYPKYVDYIYSGQNSPANWYASQFAANQWLWSSDQLFGPQSLDFQSMDADLPSRYFASPTVADLDGDGQSEIIMGNMLQNKVEIYNSSKQQISGWPQPVGGNINAAATVTNLDGDDDLEVLIGAGDGKLYAWHHTGEAVTGWPVFLAGFRILASPAVADLDGDKRVDIVVPVANGKLYALNADGTIKTGWPVSIGNVEDKFDSQIINSSPRIADVNNDGSLEIIVGSTDKKLYVFNSNGSLKWTFETGDMVLSTPVVVDIDPARSGMEIAFGSGDSYVYLLDQAGDLIWKKQTGWTVRSSPAAADLDQNGDLEIIIGSDDNKTWAWHHDGSLVSGWPQATNADLFSSPVAGDIDGDGKPEVVIGSDDSNVYAWHTFGATVSDWPKKAGLPVKGSPVLANLDNDPALEVIVGDFGGTLYIWNLSTDDTTGSSSNNQIFLPIIIR